MGGFLYVNAQKAAKYFVQLVSEHGRQTGAGTTQWAMTKRPSRDGRTKAEPIRSGGLTEGPTRGLNDG